MTEELNVERQMLRQSVTVKGTVPARLREQSDESTAASESIILALAIFHPSTLVGEVSVTDRDGKPLRVLGREEALRALETVLTVLLLSAVGEATSTAQLGPEERKLMRDVMNRIENPRDTSSAVNELAERALGLYPEVVASRFVARFIATVTAGVPLLVEVPLPADGGIEMQYERVLTYDLPMGRSLLSQVSAFLRFLVGSGPTKLVVGLSHMNLARNYKVWVRVPDGYYLRSQELTGVQASRRSVVVRLRMRRGQGLPYAYLEADLAADRSSSVDVDPRWRLSFSEVPPGKTFNAALAAGLCVLSVWLVGRVSSQPTNLGVGFPALFLALPTAAAGWLSFESPARRLSEGSLGARISLLCTLGLSLLGGTLYVLAASRSVQSGDATAIGISLLGVSEPVWILVLTAAVVNATVISYSCIRETADYVRLLSGRIG
jgi:hypothetical protein